MVRLPAGPLPRPRAQRPAASYDVYRDQSAPRPGPQRRLSAARVRATPVNHHHPAPDSHRARKKYPPDSRSPTVPLRNSVTHSSPDRERPTRSTRRVRVQIQNSFLVSSFSCPPSFKGKGLGVRLPACTPHLRPTHNQLEPLIMAFLPPPDVLSLSRDRHW